ncbi:MAG: TerB family tellurite resistance protein [Myxococcota bacterium]
MKELQSEERLKLLRLVCSMAWADSEVQQHEKGFIAKLIFNMGTPASEIRQVKKWLESPPPEEELDPSTIPQEHRQMFFEACRGVMTADGIVTEGEKTELERLEKKLGLG